MAYQQINSEIFGEQLTAVATRLEVLGNAALALNHSRQYAALPLPSNLPGVEGLGKDLVG